jgi:formylglycine-generating enzyme required for sulfatase activity
MLPNEELLEKPIKLRNACIFYLGHIPTFFDMKITAETDGKHTEPEQYTRIFERGIDPDVENPEQCHAHSEIPDEWPPLEDILQFQDRVRERIKNLYSSGQAQSPKVARVLWLGYEHEAMHLETLLYMLIQSEKTLSPPDCARPNFEVEAEQAKTEATKNEWFTIPEQDIILGIDDPDNEYGPSRHFGWDVEKPARQAHVKSFVARGRPITNGEYAEYLSQTNTEKIPASWIEKQLSNGHTNGASTSLATYLANKAVRTVYGPVPLVLALDWPVTASYDEINACAAYMGGRIPTLEETRSIYHYAQTLSTEKTSNAMTSAIPAVNGHLVHNGVTETPPPQLTTGPTKGSSEGEVEVRKRNLPNPEDVFLDLTGANVGFQRWCPTAVTPFGNKLAGQGHMGGVWEWTASPLKRHEGYEEMRLYPAYSSDFFDDKHNVVLGGSWATVPRIAGRKSFVNWYQRNYPYVWAGARVVKDL